MLLKDALVQRARVIPLTDLRAVLMAGPSAVVIMDFGGSGSHDCLERVSRMGKFMPHEGQNGISERAGGVTRGRKFVSKVGNKL
jgi:hypothetical protein